MSIEKYLEDEMKREVIREQIRDWNPLVKVSDQEIQRIFPAEAYPYIWMDLVRSRDNYRARRAALFQIHQANVARHTAQERIRKLSPDDLALIANLHSAFSLLLPAEDAATEALAEARRRGIEI